MICRPTAGLAGPCGEYSEGAHQIEGDAHIVVEVLGHRGNQPITSTLIVCKDHCPIHCQLPIEWDRPPAPTTEGTQGGLF